MKILIKMVMVSKISVLTDNANIRQCLGTVIIFPLEGRGGVEGVGIYLTPPKALLYSNDPLPLIGS